MSKFLIGKPKSIKKALSEKYGGNWKKIDSGWYDCDDNIRYVWRVATGRDMNGEYTGESSLCMYFKDGRPPEWIYL